MKLLSLILLLLIGVCSYGQTDTIYNTKSTEKIPYYEQLYRFRVWRTVDFGEKQNAGFRSSQADIVNVILENLKSGVLKAYRPRDFDFSEVLSMEDVLAKGNAVTGVENYDANKEYFTSERVVYEGKVYASEVNNNKGHAPSEASFWRFDSNVQDFLEKEDIKTMTLAEDVIFDKRRSRLYYDILGFIINDDQGLPRALINYKEFYDLVEKTSRSKEMKLRKTVLWKNRYNPSEDKTFTDAFKLRLFHGIIEKVENPDDQTITEIFERNQRSYSESVFARWEEEMKLMEKEHNLWEY